MIIEDVKVNEWYIINGRLLKVVANVNFLPTHNPYLLLQGKVGGELKIYHNSVVTIEEVE